MTDDQKTETKRDRVRRLLLTPMAEMGFRFPKGTSGEDAKRKLDRIADELAYMADDRLSDRMLPTMRTKGEGSAKYFWPEFATFVFYAHIAQPRPLADMPGIASWFGSEAGRMALEGGRLVSELKFWTDKLRPPSSEGEKRLVASRGAEQQARALRIRERLSLDLPVDPVDQGWLAKFDKQEALAMALVRCKQGDAA